MLSPAGVLGRDLRERLDRDVAAMPAAAGPGAVLTPEDLAALPEMVRRYLWFMGVVGQPSASSFRAHVRGRFRMRPGQRFSPIEAWQYNTVAPIARVFWMRIDVAGVLPMVGRDSYLFGRGRMRGTLLDAVTVADGRGDEFDVSELTTWLNDAVMVAPPMLLRAGAGFRAVDDSSFEVTLTDMGRTVAARVTVDKRGAPVTFDSRDRYADLPGGLVRAEWSTPIDGWRVVPDGRALPSRGSAVWHLPDGDFTYAELEFMADGVEHDPHRNTSA